MQDEEMQDESMLDEIINLIRGSAHEIVPTERAAHHDTDGSMTTTSIIDELRTDLAFMSRMIGCIDDNESALKLPGWTEDGHTIYTLALHPEWLDEVPDDLDLFELLPHLRCGQPSKDGLLNTTCDVKEANTKLALTLRTVSLSHKFIRDRLSGWFEDAKEKGTSVWIDLSRKKCCKIQRVAYKIIRLAESVKQDLVWHAKHGEMRKSDITVKLPALEQYLSKVVGVTVLTHMDGHREVTRQRDHGRPY